MSPKPAAKKVAITTSTELLRKISTVGIPAIHTTGLSQIPYSDDPFGIAVDAIRGRLQREYNAPRESAPSLDVDYINRQTEPVYRFLEQAIYNARSRD